MRTQKNTFQAFVKLTNENDIKHIPATLDVGGNAIAQLARIEKIDERSSLYQVDYITRIDLVERPRVSEDFESEFVLNMIANYNESAIDAFKDDEIIDRPYRLLRSTHQERERYAIQYEFIVKREASKSAPSYAGYGIPHGFFDSLVDLLEANLDSTVHKLEEI